MRWDSLFGDLDAQWHAATQDELERHITELARIELSQASFSEHLRGALGEHVAVAMPTGDVHHGVLSRVEADWLLLQADARFLLIPLAKIVRIQGRGLQRRAQVARISYPLAAALRVLARNRAGVLVEHASRETAAVRGVIDAVGADFVLIAQMADGVSRSGTNQQGNVMIPFQHMLTVMSSDENEL